MFKGLFNDTGKIRIVKLIQIITIIAFFALFVSKTLETTNTLTSITSIELAVFAIILFIELGILIHSSFKNLLKYIHSFVIRDLTKAFINFKPELQKLFKTYLEKHDFPKDINLIEISLLRC